MNTSLWGPLCCLVPLRQLFGPTVAGTVGNSSSQESVEGTLGDIGSRI